MKMNKKIVNTTSKEFLTRTEKLRERVLKKELSEVTLNKGFIKCLPSFNSVKDGFLIVYPK